MDVVLTFAVPGAARLAAADCAFQWLCLYAEANFGYPRMAFFNCGTAAIPRNFGVTSWHNNQTNDTESWLISGVDNTNMQSTRAPSKVSFVGVRSNDITKDVHVC